MGATVANSVTTPSIVNLELGQMIDQGADHNCQMFSLAELMTRDAPLEKTGLLMPQHENF